MAKKVSARKKVVKLKITLDRQIAATHRILEQIRLAQPFSETIRAIIEDISAVTKFPAVVIELFDEPTRAMVWCASKGVDFPGDGTSIRMPAEDSISGEVVRSRGPLTETNLSTRSDPYSEYWKARGLNYVA